MEWYLLLGISTGMRTMTATAVMCWFAYWQLLPQKGWASWTGLLATAIVFMVLAVGEYIGDLLPQTPNRTAPGPLAARIVFSGFVGALAAHALIEPLAGGVILGVLGALVGAYGGMWLRMQGTKLLKRDMPVGLLESLLALVIAAIAARGLHEAAVSEGLATAVHSFSWIPF
jgi:uncharacterized membrane protein